MINMSELELKERLAQQLFLEMMIEDGKEIKRLDYEGVLQNLIDTKQDIKLKEAIKDVKVHKHDFIIIRKDNLLLLQVIFSEEKVNRNKYNFELGLGNAAIVFVTTSEPFFEIAYINEFNETGKLLPLDNNEILTVNEKLINKYKDIIKRRF